MVGECSARQAHETLSGMIASGNDQLVRKACTALRAWTWKALNESRRDDDLRSWHNLMRGYSAYLEDKDPEQSIRIGVLCELIYESVSVAEVIPVSELLKRHHPRALLDTLAASGGERRLPRAELAALMKLSEASVSRVASLLAANGLVERRGCGDEVTYRITATGSAEMHRFSSALKN